MPDADRQDHELDAPQVGSAHELKSQERPQSDSWLRRRRQEPSAKSGTMTDSVSRISEAANTLSTVLTATTGVPLPQISKRIEAYRKEKQSELSMIERSLSKSIDELHSAAIAVRAARTTQTGSADKIAESVLLNCVSRWQMLEKSGLSRLTAASEISQKLSQYYANASTCVGPDPEWNRFKKALVTSILHFKTYLASLETVAKSNPPKTRAPEPPPQNGLKIPAQTDVSELMKPPVPKSRVLPEMLARLESVGTPVADTKTVPDSPIQPNPIISGLAVDPAGAPTVPPSQDRAHDVLMAVLVDSDLGFSPSDDIDAIKRRLESIKQTLADKHAASENSPGRRETDAYGLEMITQSLSAAEEAIRRCTALVSAARGLQPKTTEAVSLDPEEQTQALDVSTDSPVLPEKEPNAVIDSGPKAARRL